MRGNGHVLAGQRRDGLGTMFHLEADGRPLRAACDPDAVIHGMRDARSVDPNRLCSRVGCFQRWPADLPSVVGINYGGGQ